MKSAKTYMYKFSYTLAILIFIGPALAQVSPLQQPPPSTPVQDGGTSNVLEKLFSNPAANGSFASLYASPNNNSPYASTQGVPRFLGNMWSGLSQRYVVDAGTVLNGTLQEDLSSKTSRVGDTFAIILPDGYLLNNQQLIPQNSKIVGAVVGVMPASSQKNGVAGSVQVSIQTLVLPNGASLPISASIMYNPNQPSKLDVKKWRGVPVGEYLSSLGNMGVAAAGQVTRTIGFPLPYQTQTSGGADFVVKQGELLPVKLTQPLDMTAYMNNPPDAQTLNSPNTQIQNSPNTPMLNSPNPQMPSPQFSNPQFSNPPALNTPAPNTVPGARLPTDVNQNSTYPQGWPGNQSPSPAPNNVLPGNNEPAGPEPF